MMTIITIITIIIADIMKQHIFLQTKHFDSLCFGTNGI